MAEEEQPILENAQVGPPPRGSFMNILLVAVLILIAGVGGYFIQELISGNSESKAPSPPMQTQPVATARPALPAVGVMFPLEPFIVNLARTKGNRILKVTATLELNNPAVQGS